MNTEAVASLFRELEAIPWLRIVTIALVAYLAIRLVEALIPRLANALPPGARIRLLPLVPALRLFFGLVALLWIVPMLINPTPQNLVAVLGALGIAIGFAFKDYASSLVAGVVAVAERPYRQGDWIEFGGAYGEVRAVGLRAVRIVTPDDAVVTVPHGELWTGSVANANDGDRTLQVVVSLFVDPDHDARLLRQRLADVAVTSPWTDVTFPLQVVLDERPWATRYRVRVYPMDARDQFELRSDVTARAKEVVREVGARWPAVPVGVAEEERADMEA